MTEAQRRAEEAEASGNASGEKGKRLRKAMIKQEKLEKNEKKMGNNYKQWRMIR